MIDGKQKISFDKLRLCRRGTHRQKRFPRENRCALGNCPNIARETERAQALQKSLVKLTFCAQICNILLGKGKIFNIVNDLIQTGCNREAAAVRNLTEENIKICDLFTLARGKIAVCHSQLIKIAQHCIILLHTKHLLLFMNQRYCTISHPKMQALP